VGHEAMFPEELPRRLIKMFTFAGDTVLDPFLGSGTTVKVALEAARNAVGYEINPDFLEAFPEKTGGRDGLPLYRDIKIIRSNKKIEELPEIDYTPAIRDAVVLPQAPLIPAATATLHRVTGIIDEQTLGLDNGHRVKFLGIRVDRRFEALEYLRKRILGKQVLLKENGSTDHEIISAYVYLKNKIFINAYLIKSGMASPDLAVNHKLKKKFIELQKQRGEIEAIKAKTGE
jgi:modification methylase